MLHLFLLSFVAHKCHCSTYYTNEYDCVSCSINDDYIQCQGFAGCIYAQTIEASSSFNAYGSYSAYGSTNIASYRSNCVGDSSCRNIIHFETNTNMYCDGYRSCFGSTIERTSSANNGGGIYFSGDESGAMTTLNLNQSTIILATGRLSMSKSNINMYVSSSLYVNGFATLNGANLYCEERQTCTIFCWNYACYNVSSMSGNGNYSIDCTNNLISNLLCNEQNDDISILTLNSLPSGIKEIGVKEVDTLSLCTNSSVLGINCGNYQECESTTLLNYQNQAICCSSYQGCRYSSGTLIVNDTIDRIGIYCGGYQSCYASSSGNESFTIEQFNGDVNNISHSLDAFCDGGDACEYLDLSGADNIWCRGSSGCERATIDSIKNVFASGSLGLYHGIVSSASGNIYCFGFSSCGYSSLFDISGNVYGLSRHSLYGATINNTSPNTISNNIYVIGYRSGYLIELYNVKSVFATGFWVIYRSTISGIRNLYVNGNDSLSKSVLTTQFTTNVFDTDIDSKVRLFINGSNRFTYYVTCSDGDECFINCLSNASCTRMHLVCNGPCYLNCGDYGDANGYHCPSNITGTWYPFNVNPTSNPTSNPTILPTDLPSTTKPSQFPSQHPTKPSPSPTELPAITQTNEFSSVVSSTFGTTSTTLSASTSQITSLTKSGVSVSTTKISMATSTDSQQPRYVGNSSDILLLVIIILVVALCTIICIFVVCMFALNQKKNADIQRKQIALDIIVNKQKNFNGNNNNNNNHNNNNLVNAAPSQLDKIRSLSGPNDIVNLRDGFGGNAHDVHQKGELDVEIIDVNQQNMCKFNLNSHVHDNDDNIEELFDKTIEKSNNDCDSNHSGTDNVNSSEGQP